MNIIRNSKCHLCICNDCKYDECNNKNFAPATTVQLKERLTTYNTYNEQIRHKEIEEELKRRMIV